MSADLSPGSQFPAILGPVLLRGKVPLPAGSATSFVDYTPVQGWRKLALWLDVDWGANGASQIGVVVRAAYSATFWHEIAVIDPTTLVGAERQVLFGPEAGPLLTSFCVSLPPGARSIQVGVNEIGTPLTPSDVGVTLTGASE